MLKKILLVIAVGLLLLWTVALGILHLTPHQYAELSPSELDEAQSYLQGKLPAVPAAWQWQGYSPEPGVTLRTGLIEHENPKGTVIVVPGFTGSIEMVMHEILRLHRAGYSVASIEYRGQGASYRPLSHPEKGYVEDYAVLAADIASFANTVRSDALPLFFYSISKGAHITMRLAAEQAVDVRAYALIVPMIRINTGELPYPRVRSMAALLNGLGFGTMYAPGQAAWPAGDLVWGKAEGCNANPDTAQTQSALFASQPELRTSGTTVRWLHETMNSTDKLLDPAHMSTVTQPVKIFTAGVDELVDTSAAEQFCTSLADCSTRHYAQARHCITRENMTLYNEIIDQAVDHFDQNSG